MFPEGPRILVIGSGVTGAAAAALIRRRLPAAAVQVVSRPGAIRGGRMGTAGGADIAAQVLSVDRRSKAATSWLSELQLASLVVEAGTATDHPAEWYLRRRLVVPSLVELPERPAGWTRRDGQWEHWWVPSGCGTVPAFMMQQAAVQEVYAEIKAVCKEQHLWRVVVGTGQDAGRVGSTAYDAVVVATDPASAAELMARSPGIQLHTDARRAIEQVVGESRRVIAVCS